MGGDRDNGLPALHIRLKEANRMLDAGYSDAREPAQIHPADDGPDTYLSLWRGSVRNALVSYPKISVSAAVRDVLLARISEKTGIPAETILGESRKANHSAARHWLMYELRSIKHPDGSAKYGYIEIGRAVGRRDHTTAMNGVRRHIERVSSQ